MPQNKILNNTDFIEDQEILTEDAPRADINEEANEIVSEIVINNAADTVIIEVSTTDKVKTKATKIDPVKESEVTEGDISSFDLPVSIKKSLDRMGYKNFTEIQRLTIPMVLQGKDVLGSAQTGTGKTAAFAVPLAAKLLNSPDSIALILTPTRELAQQVYNVFRQILEFCTIKSALLIGGDSMGLQLKQLRNNPRIIVGTPGRINDHLKRKSLSLKNASYLVLDETDRMLDMGFGIQIDNILPYMAQKKQTLLFSATLSSTIVKLAAKYLVDPQRISVGEANTVVHNIDQQVVYLNDNQKHERLLQELQQREGSVLVFVKTKFGADRLADKLKRDDFSVCAIHGDLRQNKREQVIQRFRSKMYRIMVATDIAARGLDIPHIEHVINFDLTQAPEDYIHRIGRTARAGASGSAISFVSQQEESKWRAIQRLLDPNKKSDDYPSSRSSRPARGAPSRGGRPSSNFNSTPYRGEQRRRAPNPHDGGSEGRNFSGEDISEARTNNFNPRNGGDSGNFRPRSDSSSFRPRNNGGTGGDSGNFRPRGDSSSFKPRGAGAAGDSLGFRPRGDSSSFKPRGAGAAGDSLGFRPRGDSSSFKPRGAGAAGDAPGFRPRSGGDPTRFGRTARPANGPQNRGRKFSNNNFSNAGK